MTFLHRTTLALYNRKTLSKLVSVSFLSFGYKQNFDSPNSIHINKVGSQKPSFVENQRYPTEPLHKISALQVELELAGKFRARSFGNILE